MISSSAERNWRRGIHRPIPTDELDGSQEMMPREPTLVGSLNPHPRLLGSDGARPRCLSAFEESSRLLNDREGAFSVRNAHTALPGLSIPRLQPRLATRPSKETRPSALPGHAVLDEWQGRLLVRTWPCLRSFPILEKDLRPGIVVFFVVIQPNRVASGIPDSSSRQETGFVFDNCAPVPGARRKSRNPQPGGQMHKYPVKPGLTTA
jgi:hypothetical protein